MAVVSMKQFIEAGVHFGHQTRRWNPKMKPYIFGTKNGIHIINLQKSLRKLKEAHEFVRDISARGDTILFAATKPQAREIIKEEAQRSGSHYINERWLGGLLTNFNTVKQSLGQLKKLEDQRGENGLYEGIIKKEAVRLERKRQKLEKTLGGIKDMRKLPGAIFVIDCKKERIALEETQKLGVPIVAVVDTNCDPENIDYVIPGNDDAIRAIRLFSSTIANAVNEGRAIYEAQLRSAPEERPRAARTKSPRAARTKVEAEVTPAAEAAPIQPAQPEVAPAAEAAPIQPAQPEVAPAAEAAPVQPAQPEAAAAAEAAPIQPAQPEATPAAETAPIQPTQPEAAAAAETAPIQPTQPEATPAAEAAAAEAPADPQAGSADTPKAEPGT